MAQTAFMHSKYEESLSLFNEQEWLAALAAILPQAHPVDRDAVQIWFRFYPLELARYLERADDKSEAERGVALAGSFGLSDKIDTSHRFLYGHRFWPSAKSAVVDRVAGDATVTNLESEIAEIGSIVAVNAKCDKVLTTAISAVALMTLVQVRLEKFMAAAATVEKSSALMAKSPDEIVAARAKDDSQGALSFLRTVDRQYSVIRDEYSKAGRFAIINAEEVASASRKDKSRNWKSDDERCWDGPVPIECTSASCGTCWIGILGGKEKLSPVERRERRAMKVFGYNQPDEDRPFIRLACQAKASGNITITIPPWNAVFGKKVYGNVEEIELEPVTTSAKALREITGEA